MFTWTTNEGQKIVADSDASFEIIRAQYFPHIAANKWSKKKSA